MIVTSGDHEIVEDRPSCWIEVRDVVVWIHTDDNGVVVDLFRNGNEDDDPIDSAFAAFKEENAKTI